MKQVSPKVRLPEVEEQVLDYWQREDIFKRSMDSAGRESYVFYDGPPFATGLPHYGHLLAGTIKDVVGRFFTMKGFHVRSTFWLGLSRCAG